MPVQRGEVYFVDLNPAIGREQRGRRPVVVVSRDSLNRLPLVVVVVPGHGRVEYSDRLSSERQSRCRGSELAG